MPEPGLTELRTVKMGNAITTGIPDFHITEGKGALPRIVCHTPSDLKILSEARVIANTRGSGCWSSGGAVPRLNQGDLYTGLTQCTGGRCTDDAATNNNESEWGMSSMLVSIQINLSRRAQRTQSYNLLLKNHE